LETPAANRFLFCQHVEQFAELRELSAFQAVFHFKCHSLDGMQCFEHMRVTLLG
jgi:hypothetical protein